MGGVFGPLPFYALDRMRLERRDLNPHLHATIQGLSGTAFFLLNHAQFHLLHEPPPL